VIGAGIEHQVYAVAFEHRFMVYAMTSENARGQRRLLGGKTKAIGMISLGYPTHRVVAEPA
jgi:hypothetical protein